MTSFDGFQLTGEAIYREDWDHLENMISRTLLKAKLDPETAVVIVVEPDPLVMVVKVKFYHHFTPDKNLASVIRVLVRRAYTRMTGRPS